MSRPTKLTEAFIQRAEDYLNCWQEEGEAIPSIAGLALYTNVRRETLQEWMRGNTPEAASESILSQFSNITDRLSCQQELKLLTGGLSGSMNSVITKLVLSKHGYSEKQDVSHSSPDGSMSPAGNSFDVSQYEAAQSKLKGKMS